MNGKSHEYTSTRAREHNEQQDVVTLTVHVAHNEIDTIVPRIGHVYDEARYYFT